MDGAGGDSVPPLQLSLRRVELRHRHVGGDVVRGAALLGYGHPRCKRTRLRSFSQSLSFLQPLTFMSFSFCLLCLMLFLSSSTTFIFLFSFCCAITAHLLGRHPFKATAFICPCDSLCSPFSNSDTHTLWHTQALAHAGRAVWSPEFCLGVKAEREGLFKGPSKRVCTFKSPRQRDQSESLFILHAAAFPSTPCSPLKLQLNYTTLLQCLMFTEEMASKITSTIVTNWKQYSVPPKSQPRSFADFF